MTNNVINYRRADQHTLWMGDLLHDLKFCFIFAHLHMFTLHSIDWLKNKPMTAESPLEGVCTVNEAIPILVLLSLCSCYMVNRQYEIVYRHVSQINKFLRRR